MGYAIRKDSRGWRAVNGPEDVSADEKYSEDQPILPVPTTTELRAGELSTLFAAYQFDMQSLQSLWLSALIADGEDETERKDDVTLEMSEVREQYLLDVTAVKLKYSPQGA